MPFLRDYACPADHRTEHLHMGPRDTAPAEVPCSTCGEPAAPALSPTFYNPISRGNSDFSERRKAQIRARNAAYDRKQGREERVERTRAVMNKHAGT